MARRGGDLQGARGWTPCSLSDAWVHRNLQTGLNVVRTADAGRRVSIAADVIMMRDVEPHVSDAGYARSRRLGKRTVHADVRGVVIGYGDAVPDLSERRCVTYNPNRCDYFHYADTGERWNGSADVVAQGGYLWVR